MIYYAKTTRTMLAAANEIGARPFLLFQYLLTWGWSGDGIDVSLRRIANDLGMEKTAVCNLRSKLIKAGWIRYENGLIFITKTFTKNEDYSQKMNETFTKNEDYSQKMNESFTKNEQTFTKNESHYKEEKEKKEIRERERESDEEQKPVCVPAADAGESTAERTTKIDQTDFTLSTERESATPEKNSFGAAAVGAVGVADFDFAEKVENTLDWIRARKKFKGLVVDEWLQLFADCETEDIDLDEFRKFYEWTEKLEWRTGAITPKLLRGQIEVYKNRDELAKRREVKNAPKPLAKFYH